MLLSDVVGGLGQGAVYAGSSIVSAAVIGTAVYVNRRRRTSAQKLDRIYSALVGEEKSDLNPNPEPGLITKVDEYQKANLIRKEMGDQMIAEFATWKNSQLEMATKFDLLSKKVDEVVAHVKEIGRDSKALVYDSKRNNGSTSRDALARIEDNTQVARDAVDTISGAPEPVTLPEIADTLDRIDENTKPEEKK